MTALDSGTPQLPVWLRPSGMVMPQSPIFSRKPLARSMAADAPTAPVISDDVLLGAVREQVAHGRGGLLALEVEVRADVRVVERRIGVDAAVLEDDDLAVGLGLLQDLVIAGHVERGQDDDVDRRVLVELVECRDLVLELVLGVVELEVDAQLLRGLLEGRGVGGAPAALGTGLDEADGHVLVRLAAGRGRGGGGGCPGRRGRGARAGARTGRGEREDRERCGDRRERVGNESLSGLRLGTRSRTMDGTDPRLTARDQVTQGAMDTSSSAPGPAPGCPSRPPAGDASRGPGLAGDPLGLLPFPLPLTGPITAGNVPFRYRARQPRVAIRVSTTRRDGSTTPDDDP